MSVLDHRLIAAFVCVLALVMLATTGRSDEPTFPCADYQQIKQAFAANFGEFPVGRGFAEGETMVEVLAAPDGDFTLIFVHPDETTPSGLMACGIASGSGWHRVDPEL